MELKELIEYWQESSEEDLETAEVLYSQGRYSHSLFFCHLALEKLLKGLVVDVTSQPAPYEHNLLYLATLSGIDFTNEQQNLLAEINTFNISGRYDDYKFAFYKKATREYTKNYLDFTNTLYIWMKQKLTKI